MMAVTFAMPGVATVAPVSIGLQPRMAAATVVSLPPITATKLSVVSWFRVPSTAEVAAAEASMLAAGRDGQVVLGHEQRPRRYVLGRRVHTAGLDRAAVDREVNFRAGAGRLVVLVQNRNRNQGVRNVAQRGHDLHPVRVSDDGRVVRRALARIFRLSESSSSSSWAKVMSNSPARRQVTSTITAASRNASSCFVALFLFGVLVRLRGRCATATGPV